MSEGKFLWKNQISARLTDDEVDLMNQLTEEGFPEFNEETTQRQGILAIANRAMSVLTKIRQQRNPADIEKIKDLEDSIQLLQNEIGKQKIDIDFKIGQIDNCREALFLANQEIDRLKNQSEEIENIKSSLPGANQVVVSLAPHELALLRIAEQKLTVRYKKPITPGLIIKELLFSYFKEESELNIPYVITSTERSNVKKLHPEEK